MTLCLRSVTALESTHATSIFLFKEADTNLNLSPSQYIQMIPVQAYLCIIRIQLLTEQLGIRVADVPDAKEALQATRQADRHLKVCHLFDTAQHQHSFFHILGKKTKYKLDSVLVTFS